MDIDTTAVLSDSDDDSFVDVARDLQGTVSLSVYPKHETIGLGSGLSTTQVCATMTAKDLPSEHHRTPVDVIVSLDLSSSMEGRKLERCKSTLTLLLRHLQSQDRFGLISYSGDARTEIPMKLMTKENKEEALNVVKSLKASGCTNMSAAVTLAFQELRAVNAPNKVRSIFFLTDGYANAGISNPSDLVELTKSCWGFSSSPISLTAFGYGDHHNATLLRDLAAASETGAYYHIEDDINVSSAFGDAIGGMLSAVAQSAVLSVKPCQNCSIERVYHDRAIQRDNGSFTVNVGDFYAEETRDVVFEVTLTHEKGDHPIPHAVVSLSYTDILLKKPVDSSPQVCAIRRPDNTTVSKESDHVAAQWLRVVATQEMKRARQLADDNQMEQARAHLQSLSMKCKESSNAVQMNEMIQELVRDLEEAKIHLVSRNPDKAKAFLASKNQTYVSQRSSEASASQMSSYRGKYRRQSATMFSSVHSAPDKKRATPSGQRSSLDPPAKKSATRNV